MRTARWVGLAVCVLLAGAAVTSTRWHIWWEVSTTLSIGIVEQHFAVFKLYGFLADLEHRHVAAGNARGWRIFGAPNGPNEIRGRWPVFIFDDDYSTATVPLWMPLVLGAVLTGILWWLAPNRRKPGHCRCGYNLTGNVSGRCPECGQAVSR